MEMEKQKMDMFSENEDEKQDTYFDLTELKEYLKTLPPNERHGQGPNEEMSEIDMVIKELEAEEKENNNTTEPEN